MSKEGKLSTRMRLWEFPDKYVVETAHGVSDSYLTISRVDGTLKTVADLQEISSSPNPKICTIYGVAGMLKLIEGTYVLVITERESVGTHFGSPVYKVSSLQVLKCNQAISSAEKKKLENEFSVLLSAAERMTGLYFSYEANLTLSMQRLNDLGDDSKHLPLWRQVDPRFVWNSYMLEILIDNELDSYLLPIIQGNYQKIEKTVGKEVSIDVTLIARRCTRRIGTRMWRRGADVEGYAANYVETEQILQCNGHTASFVQVRGSIPFLWEQIVDLTYKPRFEIVKPEDAPQVVERHFLDLRKTYGSVLAIDLVNKHGSEGVLSEVYAKAMQRIVSDQIRYVHFDFHRICGHVHFERLSLLYEQIKDFLISQSYFLQNSKGEIVDGQKGIVRTNCIDCLDRTNVTQSLIGRKMLETQLHRIGVFGEKETISSHTSFDESYKIMWANHGDAISIQYSGTPALKGDFVRYGKRTTRGILNDGYNALARYYFNNFSDGTKQDAMDLLHGHYIVTVNREMRSSSQVGLLESYASFPLASAVVLLIAFFAVMSLRQAHQDMHHILLSAVCAVICFFIISFVRANGRTFCNRPRLHKPR